MALLIEGFSLLNPGGEMDGRGGEGGGGGGGGRGWVQWGSEACAYGTEDVLEVTG